MRSATSFLFSVIGALVVLGVAGFALLMWQFNRPPFDLGKLQELQPGMSQQQVRQILGEPSSHNATNWNYSRSMAWPIVHVHFDANGRLESHEYDY